MANYYPPSRGKLETCARIGLTVEPWMSNQYVTEALEKARNDPLYRDRYAAYEMELAAENEREDREHYGDALYEEYKRWDSLEVTAHYIVKFQRGKTTGVDIVEIGDVEADPESKRKQLAVGLMFPKRVRDRASGDYLEWERHVVFLPSQILSIEKLGTRIDLFDVERYQQLVEEARTRLLERR